MVKNHTSSLLCSFLLLKIGVERNMQKNNALLGVHIRSKKEAAVLKLHHKQYIWLIPEHLMELNIQPGDIVAVGKGAPVLVMAVFRDDTESHKYIYRFLERSPQSSEKLMKI